MNTKRNRKGSALLLTVSLLSIILSLGLTFLIVARLDSKASDALVSRSQADPIAHGVVARISGVLQADLYIDNDGPYGDTARHADAEDKLRAFVDYASDDVDPHLTFEYPEGDPHYSKLFGDNGKLIDVDADGENDAYLVPSGTMNSHGEEYYVAVKIVDLSGKACINTGGDVFRKDGKYRAYMPYGPVSYELVELLGDDFDFLYDYDEGQPRIYGIHEGRCGNYGKNPQRIRESDMPSTWDYYLRCGRVLSRPYRNYDEPYRPFGIDCETFFLFFNEDHPLKAGRVARPMTHRDVVPVELRRQFTTYSVSRQVPRVPQDNDAQLGQLIAEVTSDWPTELELRDLSQTDVRADLFDAMVRMLDQLGLEDSMGGLPGKNTEYRKKMAACFVANLWAYVSDEGDGAPWPVTADLGAGQTFTAYGMKQDLVITEAYAMHKPESAPDAGDHVAGYAIEILNPTNRWINTKHYRLKISNSDGTEYVDLPDYGVKYGRKVVFYSYIEGPGYSGNQSQLENDTNLDPQGHWKELGKTDDDKKLRFDDDRVVTLIRDFGSSPDITRVPYDQVSADDLGYGAEDIQVDEEEIRDIQRDDDLDRCRFNVAAYEDRSPSGPGDDPHDMEDSKAGKNSVSADDLLDHAAHAVPIFVLEDFDTNGGKDEPHEKLRSIGFLSEIYMTSSFTEPGGNLVPFSKALRRTDFLAYFPDDPLRGRLDPRPSEVPAFWGSASRPYPPVPIGALVPEFFSCLSLDETRPDEPRRVFGRINVNSASKEVLAALPWPKKIFGRDVNRETIAEYIIAYRDKLSSPRDYSTRENTMTNLRKNADGRGFMTVGEVAIPIADYANSLAGWSDYSKTVKNDSNVRSKVQRYDYAYERDMMFRDVSNLLTVQSDTYAAIIRVQIGDEDEPKYAWDYLAVFDRSNCKKKSDIPALLMFTTLK